MEAALPGGRHPPGRASKLSARSSQAPDHRRPTWATLGAQAIRDPTPAFGQQLTRRSSLPRSPESGTASARVPGPESTSARQAAPPALRVPRTGLSGHPPGPPRTSDPVPRGRARPRPPAARGSGRTPLHSPCSACCARPRAGGAAAGGGAACARWGAARSGPHPLPSGVRVPAGVGSSRRHVFPFDVKGNTEFLVLVFGVGFSFVFSWGRDEPLDLGQLF